MQTSARGIAFLEKHEGVVLRAYRDVAGVWTIGAGLTKASGVVTPQAGMVITRAQASTLLAKALTRNYEPDVRHALPGARQHEFDGGISFHFNTGAIGRASWVQAWVRRDWPAVRSGLAAWCRAGGRVVRGLTLRRQAEFELIRDGHYADGAPAPAPTPLLSSWAPSTTSSQERETVRAGLVQLGFAAGAEPGTVLKAGAVEFQRRYGLTTDGIIGPATRATLQRALNARTRLTLAGTTTAAPIAGSGVGAPLGDNPWMLVLPGLLWLGWLAYTHRDAIAALLTDRAPSLARYLRSF